MDTLVTDHESEREIKSWGFRIRIHPRCLLLQWYWTYYRPVLGHVLICCSSCSPCSTWIHSFEGLRHFSPVSALDPSHRVSCASQRDKMPMSALFALQAWTRDSAWTWWSPTYNEGLFQWRCRPALRFRRRCRESAFIPLVTDEDRVHHTKLYLTYFEFTENTYCVPAGVETVVTKM